MLEFFSKSFLFLENQITIDQLPLLDDNLLKEIIPQIGPRLTVLKEIQRIKDQNDPLVRNVSSIK